MTYRNRPAPRRRHRARWQDELRTQRILVGGFAVAIAVALGLFGISAWNSYYDAHLRQVMVVEGTAVIREELDLRQAIMGAELAATGTDITDQMGGQPAEDPRPPTARDAVLQQQLSVISDQLTNLTATATSSISDGLFQATRADEFGITVSDETIDEEIETRQNLPARALVSIIEVDALPEDAATGDDPTEEDFARALEEATAIRDRLDAGEDFGTVAAAESDDAASAQTGGLVGWVTEEDPQYGPLFTLAEGVEAGELTGPTETETGYTILRVEDRTEAGPFTELLDQLSAARVSEADYRTYVTDELMRRGFRTHFEEEVAVSPASQREIAQILVLNDEGVPVPKQRLRHLLAQPVPGGEVADQEAATDEQWAAAEARAEAWYDEVQDPEADWFELAEESDDPGSRNNGGDLGWYDPTTGQFVPEFEATVARLAVGEISEPVRTDFGYHVIQVTDQRTTALDFAESLIEDLQADPDSFGDQALTNSEDSATRTDEGYLGWVARYEGTATREEAIFGLAEIGEITTQPVVDGNQIWIFQLRGINEERLVEESRLNTIRSTGYSRWYEEVQADGEIWIDTQLQLDAAPPAA